jgi:hypothetical protein
MMMFPFISIIELLQELSTMAILQWIAGVIECVLHSTLQELSGREGALQELKALMKYFIN